MRKIALITGASSGIGRATAIALATEGFNLILCGRRSERLEAVKTMVQAQASVVTLLFDVRKPKEVDAAFESLSDSWKNIDVLVNSAGNAHGLSPIDEGNLEDWDAMIDGNVKGLLYVSRKVMPQMVKRKTGHIVNLSSVAGKHAYQNAAVYCATKNAVEGISQCMRLDLTQHGIKITNIAPGAVETEFSMVRLKGDIEKAKKVYEGYKALQAEDIANAIAYAVMAPSHVTIADMTIYPLAQAGPGLLYRNQ